MPGRDPGAAASVETALAPLLRGTSEVLASLVRAVDDRVLVALVRGLWEHVSAGLEALLKGGGALSGAGKQKGNKVTAVALPKCPTLVAAAPIALSGPAWL